MKQGTVPRFIFREDRKSPDVKPAVLFFDEATSVLENITQKAVSDSTGKMNCTRLIIAHRLSTIINCDRIIYLDKGYVVEEGTYELQS